jgi:thioredoxin 1
VRKTVVLVALLGLLAGTALLFADGKAALASEVPVKGMVTMVDVGADRCVPCKMMAPIMKELEEEYAGKASIIFIDVWKNTAEAVKYDVNVIPTQIFYDKDGKEISRHEGFMDKKSIIAMLEKLGAGK